MTKKLGSKKTYSFQSSLLVQIQEILKQAPVLSTSYRKNILKKRIVFLFSFQQYYWKLTKLLKNKPDRIICCTPDYYLDITSNFKLEL